MTRLDCVLDKALPGGPINKIKQNKLTLNDRYHICNKEFQSITWLPVNGKIHK